MRRNSSVNLIVTIIAILALVLVLIPIFSGIGDLSDAVNKAACEHKQQDTKLSESSAKIHIFDITCKDCGEVLEENQSGNHNWSKDGICTFCKYVCKHIDGVTKSGTATAANSTKHKVDYICNECRMITNSALESHNWNTNGKCSVCNYYCRHDDTAYSVSLVDHLTHHVNYHCNVCGEDFNYYDELHSFVDGICIACDYETCGCDEMEDEGVQFIEVITEDGCGARYVCAHGNEITSYFRPHIIVSGVCKLCSYSCPHTNHLTGYCLDCNSLTDPCDQGCTEFSSGNKFLDGEHDGTATGCYQIMECVHGHIVSVEKYDHEYINGVCWSCGFKKP